MDPNANLKRQRSIAAEILKVWDDCNADGTLTAEQLEHVGHLANELAELVEALDQWISRGGFLPAVWDRK